MMLGFFRAGTISRLSRIVGLLLTNRLLTLTAPPYCRAVTLDDLG